VGWNFSNRRTAWARSFFVDWIHTKKEAEEVRLRMAERQQPWLRIGVQP